jgi:hypothetical protein
LCPAAGNAAATLLLLTFFAAMHSNGVLLLCLGLPLDRALPWHKLLALSSLANAAVHVAAWGGNGRQERRQTVIEERYVAVAGRAFQADMELSGANFNHGADCVRCRKRCRWGNVHIGF